MMVSIRTVCVVLLFALMGACAHRAHPETGSTSANAKTTLRVVNQSFPDMDIFVLSSGQRIRLGMATGNSSTTLTIPDYLVRGVAPMRFIASPVGGVRQPVSEEITVQPGDQVTLTIPPSE